jgi:hypothetical protein
VLSVTRRAEGTESPKARRRTRKKKKSSRAMGAEADAGETGGGGADGPGEAIHGHWEEPERFSRGVRICHLRVPGAAEEGEVRFDAWCACGGAGFTGEGC